MTVRRRKPEITYDCVEEEDLVQEDFSVGVLYDEDVYERGYLLPEQVKQPSRCRKLVGKTSNVRLCRNDAKVDGFCQRHYGEVNKDNPTEAHSVMENYVGVAAGLADRLRETEKRLASLKKDAAKLEKIIHIMKKYRKLAEDLVFHGQLDAERLGRVNREVEDGIRELYPGRYRTSKKTSRGRTRRVRPSSRGG